jgi:hypothetical protein
VPAEAWSEARLVPVAALRLVELRYPVSAYLESVKDEKHDHPRPVRKDSFTAVYRRSHAVYRLDLGKPAFALLEDPTGKKLSRALRAATRRGGRPPGEDQLFRWFREWVSVGIFSRVETA